MKECVEVHYAGKYATHVTVTRDGCTATAKIKESKRLAIRRAKRAARKAAKTTIAVADKLSDQAFETRHLRYRIEALEARTAQLEMKPTRATRAAK